MKRNILVSLVLSMLLFSCAPKVVYVDRPVNNNPAPTSGGEQTYQPPAGAAYTQNNNQQQQYNNSGQDQYSDNQQYNNNGQYNSNNQQQYNSNNQNNQESDQQYYANQQNVNYNAPSNQTFYDELSPYGSWVNYQNYGNVWVPAQGQGFTPYASNGQWVYTQYGMTWQSNYNWGWAPFHYGSWILDPFYGWMWVPGNVWAPAQVTWGQYNGYYGWAPNSPGYYNGYRPASEYWTFVPQNQIAQPNVYMYAADRNVVINHNVANVALINNSASYNNAVYNAGPKREEIEHATGHSVTPVTISEANKPVPAGHAISGGNMSIYRPALTQVANAAPAHIVPIENVKTVNATAVNGSFNHTAAPGRIGAVRANPAPANTNLPRQVNTHQERSAPNQQPSQQQRTAPAQQNNNPNQNRQPRPQQQQKPKAQPKPAPKPQQERH